MGHAIAHFPVQRLAGGDVGHSQRAVGGEFFGQATLAGASAAEDQLEHGFFPRIFVEATSVIASRLAPTELCGVLCGSGPARDEALKGISNPAEPTQ
ncbi:hypothetical protein D3C80_1641950 [compost metagenome]